MPQHDSAQLPVSVAAGNPVDGRRRRGDPAQRRQRGRRRGRDGAGLVRRRDASSPGSAAAGSPRTTTRRPARRRAWTSSSPCPGLGGRRSVPPLEIAIDFGGQVVPYAVGASTVAVPGRAGRGRRAARALGTAAVAGRGRARRSAHAAQRRAVRAAALARCSATVAPAMLLGEGGGRTPARRRSCSPAARTLFHPGLDRALQHACATRARRRSTPGRSREAMVARDRRPGRPRRGRPGGLPGARVARPATVDVRRPSRCRPAATTSTTCSARSTALELQRRPGELAVDAGRRRCARTQRRGDTTSLAAVDADGNACAVTTSLGLSSGVWLADLGIHLNSMLGEGELVRGDEVPGRRMGSMMSPLVVARRRTSRCWSPARRAAAGSGRRCSRCSSTCCTTACRVADAIARRGSTRCPDACTSSPASPTTVLARAGAPTTRWCGGRRSTRTSAASPPSTASGPGADPRRGGDVRRI